LNKPCVLGFPAKKDLTWTPIPCSKISAPRHFETKEPNSGVQFFDVGLCEGNSGAPFLAFCNGQWACAGVAYLGSSGASNSRIIWTNEVRAFLRENLVQAITTSGFDNSNSSTAFAGAAPQNLSASSNVFD